MYHQIRTILIFLILGAILNVAVAWGCALLIDVYSHGTDDWRLYEYDEGITWEVRSWNRWGAVSLYSLHVYARLKPVSRPRPEDPDPHEIIPDWGNLTNYNKHWRHDLVARESRIIDGRGWPMITLWCEPCRTLESLVRLKNDKYFVQAGTQGGFTTKLPPWRTPSYNLTGFTAVNHPRVLPYRPIWFGFIFNTLFYSLNLWLFIVGPSIHRRRRRIRRGLCGRCGYVVSVNAGLPGASPNCTECGTPLPENPIVASPK